MEPTAGGGSAFIAQVTLYSAALGVAISQACYATTGNHERAVLRQLIGELDLEGVHIQADALQYSAPVFWQLQEQRADFLLTVKGNQKTLHRQISSQFQGKRKIPFVATDHEAGHGRDITWMLRARQASEHISEAWIGTSWIVDVMASGTR
jgi:predicted transposase YbfD/YdcC